MTKVRFEPAHVTVDAEVDTPIIDLVDEEPDADVPFSCRSASCGACRVEVIAGMHALSPIDEDEQETLDLFDDGPNVRLCCQIELVQETDEEIVLRVVEPL